MKTRNQPRKNYKEPTDDESTVHTSEEMEYHSESPETDGSILSQDRKFIEETEQYSADPDAAYTIRKAPIYVSSEYTDDVTECLSGDSDVTFIERRKKT